MTRNRPTVKQARNSHPLAAAVLNQLGGGADAVQSALDAAEHGADGGFGGFIYYSETGRFTARNRIAIAQAVADMADDLGESPIDMVRGFRCLAGLEDADEAIAVALYGGRARNSDVQQSVDLVENALAWFALEEVGRAIESLAE